jgi:hypothetical protein
MREFRKHVELLYSSTAPAIAAEEKENNFGPTSSSTTLVP